MRAFYQLNIMGYLVDVSRDFGIVRIYDTRTNESGPVDFYDLSERTRYDILDYINSFEESVTKSKKSKFY